FGSRPEIPSRHPTRQRNWPPDSPRLRASRIACRLLFLPAPTLRSESCLKYSAPSEWAQHHILTCLTGTRVVMKRRNCARELTRHVGPALSSAQCRKSTTSCAERLPRFV